MKKSTFYIVGKHAVTEALKNPKKLVPWYNGTGVLSYVIGMMISAIGLGYF